MKTNSKAVRNKIKTHILECVHNEYGDTFDSIQNACDYMWERYNTEYNHEYEKLRTPNEQERFQGYLQGIPFNFLFYTNAICEFLETLDINPKNKKYTDEASEKLYYYLIYAEVIKNKSTHQYNY